jgi:hypothetical protein
MAGDNSSELKASAGVQKYFQQNAESLRGPMDAQKIGLSEEEYLKRKKEAAAPYKIKRPGGQGNLTVSSSARAQQIMSAGTAEKLRDGRRQEIKQKIVNLNVIRWSVMALGSACFIYIVYEVMLPISQLHWKRSERLRRRHEEIFIPAMEKLLQEQERLGPDAPTVKAMTSADHRIPRSPSSV